MTRKARGLSLAEVIVATALLGLISTYVALLIKYGFEYMRASEERAELQRTSLFVLSSITRELAESSGDCITYASGTSPYSGIVYGSPRGLDNQVEYQDGHLLWRKWVCIYYDSSQKLLMRAEEALSPESTFKPDPSPAGFNKTVGEFITGAAANRSVLTRNVSSFSASTLKGVTGNREVLLRLEVQVGEGSRSSTLSTRTGVRPNH